MKHNWGSLASIGDASVENAEIFSVVGKRMESRNVSFNQGFQLFCKVAYILLKAPDVNVFLTP